MKISYEFNSFDEVTIKGYKWWNPELIPDKIVIISHGMAEKIERYDDFAEFLVSSGMVVYGHSHRGHGATAKSIESLGYIGIDGWNRMVDDIKTLVEMAKSEYPHAKIVLFGHSMGSFLVRDFILDHSSLLDGVILSGTGTASKFELGMVKFIAKSEINKNGDFHKSNLLDKMSFGSFNKKIKNPKTKFDWLSTDENQVMKYIDDPYCGQVHTSSFFLYFAKGMEDMLYHREFRNRRSGLPMLLMSGKLDPVGKYGKAVIRAESYYKSNSFNTRLKLYENGRHEMLNEVNRLEVFKDIFEWLKLV